jgi:hypothetical protein
LSSEHIGKACSVVCQDVRNCRRCCNDKFCRDQFSRTECERAIRELREHIWTEGCHKTPGCVTSRKEQLISVLKTQIVMDDHEAKQLFYRINGKEVCKSFYKSAIAIPTKMFNSAVAFVLESESNAGAVAFGPKFKTRGILIPYRDSMVLSFLDTFFHSQGKRKLVDTSPNATGYMKESFTVRMKWTQLYHQYYLKSMESCDEIPVDYDRFCELRSKHRPNYIRHRKVSNKKWSHMECKDCVLLEEKIHRNLRNPELKVISLSSLFLKPIAFS